jgi:hypothetical protein
MPARTGGNIIYRSIHNYLFVHKHKYQVLSSQIDIILIALLLLFIEADHTKCHCDEMLQLRQLVFVLPFTLAFNVSRMMNNTNFPGHNIPNAGCDPNISTNYSTAEKCQAACDASQMCNMWTFVPPTYKPAGGHTWCCLKGCSIGDKTCPAPEKEDGVVSGAKSPKTYGVCTGPACFDFDVDWSSGGPNTTLPGCSKNVPRCSVRKLEAVYYPPDGKTYAYVDIVNFSNYYYPDSYSTEVGVFSSPDGKTAWEYHGIVIARGEAGGWDGGGIASPGSSVVRFPKVCFKDSINSLCQQNVEFVANAPTFALQIQRHKVRL